MREFRDSAGNAWQLDVEFGCILRVKAASQGRFNLLDPESKCGAREIRSVINADETNDYETLLELLFYLVEPQAMAREIDCTKFATLLRGPAMLAAQDALIKEWSDFFRQLQRLDKAAALERMATYNAKALQKVKEKLESPEMGELDAKADAKMDAVLNDTFGKLLASLDSTPAPSPGGSSTPCAPAGSETSGP